MGKRSIFALITLLMGMWLWTGSPVLSADVTVDATLSHQTFSVDEGAQLSIAVNGVRKNVAIDLPEIDNIVIHPRGQSSQTSFINGKTSASITYNYIVQGLVPGKYTIPPVSVMVGGQEMNTNAIAFEVTASGSESAATGGTTKSLKDIAYITVSEIGEHYPGEIVPITLKAYFNKNYRVELNSLPTLTGDGVVMPQLGNDPDQKEEVIGGVPFHVLTWQTSLSGIKTGQHQIKFSLDASLLVAQQRRSRTPFSGFGGSMFDDSVFDSFFGNVEKKPIRAASPDITFPVNPLPTEGRPDTFTGAIGNFTLNIFASPLKVEVGDPITLNMTIAGEGNFNRVEAPVFPENQLWKTYTPTSDYSEDTSKLSGSKSFEQAVVVKQPGVTEIPSLSFSYFDPIAQKYVTIDSEPIPLQVAGPKGTPSNENTGGLQTVLPSQSGSSTSVATTPPTQVTGQTTSENRVPIMNLAPIHLETGSFQDRLAPIFKRAWFLVLSSLCLLLIAILLYLNWRRQKQESQPGLDFHKKRQTQLQNDLTEVEQARDSADALAFLNKCRMAIQNHLASPRMQSASAMSYTDLKKLVAEDSPLLTIFHRAEEAAYGGATLSQEEMATYVVQLKTELEKL
jgi:hypothetical protein